LSAISFKVLPLIPKEILFSFFHSLITPYCFLSQY
jgi:hypothetical protein